MDKAHESGEGNTIMEKVKLIFVVRNSFVILEKKLQKSLTTSR